MLRIAYLFLYNILLQIETRPVSREHRSSKQNKVRSNRNIKRYCLPVVVVVVVVVVFSWCHVSMMKSHRKQDML